MNILMLREIDALRRVAGRNIERWKARGGEVRDLEGTLIANFEDPDLAAYVARLHNLFVPLTNAVVELRQKLIDTRSMRKELNAPSRTLQ